MPYYMTINNASFTDRISANAFHSSAVIHPYLTALCEGQLPDMPLAFKDFALNYGAYSSNFTHYITATIDGLGRQEHKDVLRANLAEEQGHIGDIVLPKAVAADIEGKSHASLFRRFQHALGVDADDRDCAIRPDVGLAWSQKFQLLCKQDECTAIGAVGFGTELIVSRIYTQILEAIKSHSNLLPTDYVFFDLHSVCDDDHADQLLSIADDLAVDAAARAKIERGAIAAIDLRASFWDAMLERAENPGVINPAFSESILVAEQP